MLQDKKKRTHQAILESSVPAVDLEKNHSLNFNEVTVEENDYTLIKYLYTFKPTNSGGKSFV
jgi:hypothetical protein